MKKKILFIIPSYIHGGTNKSLSNIIPYLNKLGYEVELFSMIKKGPYQKVFKSWDNIKLIKENMQLSNILGNITIPFSKFFSRVYKFIFLDLYYQKIAMELSKGEYDVVIAMEEDIATRLASFIKSPKKIAWVRCDYSEYYKAKKRNELNVYNKYDKIICVSKYTKDTFIQIYPSLNGRTTYMHNVIDYNRIKELAAEDIEDNRFISSKYVMVSIGRLSAVKQFEKIPLIANSLREKEIEFRWYIIGEGNEREKIESSIKQYNLVNNVVLLGEKNNPYPYIKKSDFVCVLSKSEACPNVINESKILHKPVITTNFGSAKEFVINNINGIISTIEDYDKNLINLINDNKLLFEINKNIEKFSYDNDLQLIKLKQIFEAGEDTIK